MTLANLHPRQTLFTLIILSLLAVILPQKSLGDNPYVCPYPCLPPPIAGSIYPSPPVPALPPPSTTSSNCPPPPSPPSEPTYYASPPPPEPTYYASPPPPATHYYYSPPPPYSPGGYVPSYDYYPPPGGYMFPYGNAPPPPNPILPYWPYYFKHPPPQFDASSATSVRMINKMRLYSTSVGLVVLSFALTALR